MSGEDHLDPELRKLIEKSQQSQQVDLKNLPNDIEKLEVRTKNSAYTLVMRSRGQKILGGRFEEYTDCFITGSTAGGSSLWIQKLIIGFQMEIVITDKKSDDDTKTITTSTIREITVFGKTWQYSLS